MDDESHWQQQLVLGLVMLLVIGALLGAIVAIAGIKVADLAGITGTPPTTRSDERLRVPRNAETPTTAPSKNTPRSTGPTGPPTTAPARRPPGYVVTLALTPSSVAPYERIYLRGTYRAPDGTSLQVQRREAGSWVAFPVTATVSGGRFHTYIETGHTGVNRFRVTDTARGVSSGVATVTVR